MNKIIICPNEEKLNILEKYEKDENLHNIKFMTIKEFINNYYFSYNEEAIFYLMNKYNYNIDVAKVYLNNLYFIDIEKKYTHKKLIFLQDIKKELIENKLLHFNNIFKKYIKNKEIEVINYYDLDKYIENALNYKVEIPKVNLDLKVYEFNSMEEEVNFVCIKIRELLKKNIDINKIFLTNVSSDYHYILNKLFNYYQIPININYQDSIFGTTPVQEYLKTKELDLSDSNKSIINKKIVNILNDLIELDKNNPIYEKILINKLKNTYLPVINKSNAINIKTLEEYSFKDDEYVFVLGFNMDSLPKTNKDIEYITDSLKDEVDLYDINYLNKREKEKTIYLLSRIKNITISYKLSSPFQKYYKSNLITDLGLEVIKESIDTYKYTNKYNKIRLGEDLDKYYLYKEKTEVLNKLYNKYNINYNTYTNKFTGIDNNLYLEQIPYPMRFSYTHLNSYNECKFKYYINYILKLGTYTPTFAAFIGSMYHKILTLYRKDNFDLDIEFKKYLENRELSLKEKTLLVKIRKDIEELIKVLKSQQLLTGYDNDLYEKEFKVIFNKKVSIEFVGYIDKIMYYKNMDDTYFSIIDYKTGSIDTNIELIKYGLHMQLPIYLFLVNYSNIISNPIFTGIYYQNILFNYPTWSKTLEKDIKNRYLLKGYSTDNIKLLERFDSTYEDSNYIKSMKYTEEKGFSRYTKLIDDNTMINMTKYVKKHIDEKLDQIIEADFEIDPKVYDGENISCKFCSFKDLCFMKNDDIKYLDKVEDLSFLGGEE